MTLKKKKKTTPNPLVTRFSSCTYIQTGDGTRRGDGLDTVFRIHHVGHDVLLFVRQYIGNRSSVPAIRDRVVTCGRRVRGKRVYLSGVPRPDERDTVRGLVQP